MFNNQSPPTHAEFEKLFINNHSLDKIHAYLNRFNPINVMKMSGQEIRHSNILAWLLDPSETHGLGDRFLKSFLTEALRGEYSKGGLTAVDIIQADLRNVEILREWQNIDIFLLSRQNNFAIIIENKLNSKQHNGQLKKYIDKVKNTFKDSQPALKIKGIFLTLHDEEAEDPSYACIGYDSICEILPWVMAVESSSLSKQVSVFIKHYIETIKEATGMSEELKEMEKLAKSLYRQNRKILDFIWEHGTSTEFNLALDDLFGDEWQENEYVILEKNKQKILNLWNSSDIFSFLPYEWNRSLGGYNQKWVGCENWWSGYPVICWIQLIRNEDSSGTLRLFAEVGPLENHTDRQELIQYIKNIAHKENLKQVSFQKGAGDVGRKYSKFLKNNSRKIDDVQDVDKIAEGIEDLLHSFQDCLKKISIALDQFYKSIHH
ncbi:PD-(D/E)XK nuclease family protein [Acinetobacter guillouiae]|uniref:PDDEXK-like family protein n=1 Tax=Acinetobacter guillouiae TaxID=106649 RepID=UPI0028EE9767|nr:PD-(D/E)XK nuclease family protein [Acinetobacter guillouiae]